MTSKENNAVNNILFSINTMTLELLELILSKCNTFEEFKQCVIISCENIRKDEVSKNDKNS